LSEALSNFVSERIPISENLHIVLELSSIRLSRRSWGRFWSVSGGFGLFARQKRSADSRISKEREEVLTMMTNGRAISSSGQKGKL